MCLGRFCMCAVLARSVMNYTCCYEAQIVANFCVEYVLCFEQTSQPCMGSLLRKTSIEIFNGGFNVHMMCHQITQRFPWTVGFVATLMAVKSCDVLPLLFHSF